MTSPTMTLQRWRFPALFALAAAMGCGGGSLGGGNKLALYSPCPAANRLGGFNVDLTVTDGSPGFTSMTGAVRNAADPREVWVGGNANGCALVTGPMLSCTPECAQPMICAGNNTCVAAPAGQNAGAVTVTGVGPAPIDVTRIASANTYYTTLMDPFPPFAVGDNVTLAAAGADVPAFTLEGRGIEPLVFAGTGILIGRDKPLDITWTAPAAPGATKIYVRVDIAHHGGIAARIDCHVDDTGSTRIPAALVNMLIDKGTAGFPSVVLTRRTVDSETLAAGCVDFAVTSQVERLVMVEGVTSCTNVGTADECPSGQVCGDDLKCS
jgi:hypothetical protein